MKLQKFLNDNKLSFDAVKAAAKKIGITNVSTSTDLSDDQITRIRSVLNGDDVTDGVAGSDQTDYSSAIALLVDEVGQELLFAQQFKPQIRAMIQGAVAQYQQDSTPPPNPQLAGWVRRLTSERETRIEIEASSAPVIAPKLNLLEWANDETGKKPVFSASDLPALEAAK